MQRSGRAPETVHAEPPEIHKERRRETGVMEGGRNDIRDRVRVLEEGRRTKPCAIAIGGNWSRNDRIIVVQTPGEKS
jgi:hypothetical protein